MIIRHTLAAFNSLSEYSHMVGVLKSMLKELGFVGKGTRQASWSCVRLSAYSLGCLEI